MIMSSLTSLRWSTNNIVLGRSSCHSYPLRHVYEHYFKAKTYTKTYGRTFTFPSKRSVLSHLMRKDDVELTFIYALSFKEPEINSIDKYGQFSLGKFPHQASLRYGGKHSCGASIISPTKILTAAHCVEGMNIDYFQVATGTIDVNGGQLHKVLKAVIHPGYTGQQKAAWGNDVAVITLAAPIKYSQYQNPIALATVFPSAGNRVASSGWGRTSVSGDLSDKLQKMGQEVVGYNECQKRHAGMPLDNSHLCAFSGKGVGFCLGDTGGPLIANGMQVGIASWVLPCAQGVPDVYANVAYLRNFILSQM